MAAAIALAVILAALAVFQLALALGAPLGRFAWGGQHRVLPAGLRVGSAVSIVVYAVIVVLALDKVGVIDIVPDGVSDVGMWVAFGYFVLGIPMAEATGISMMVIAMNSAAALLGYQGRVEIQWGLVLAFTAIVVAATLAAGRVAPRIRVATLMRAFAVMIIGVGALVLFENLR